MLKDIHTFFDLEVSKIVATVTDNEFNFVEASNEYGVRFEETKDSTSDFMKK